MVDFKWQPPADWLQLSTIDMHTGGEPLRVLIGGLPPIEGQTVLQKRRYFREHYDQLRTGLMWEPRGHADMYGAILLPSSDADFDVFFIHNEGYSTMCGHAIIALTTLAVEAHLVAASDEVRLTFNVPAGKVHARARLSEGQVREVYFRNVPSYVFSRDQIVDVEGLGSVRFDIAYGGAYYALVEAAQFGFRLTENESARLIEVGRRITREVASAHPVQHPFEPDLSFLYGTIFTGPAHLAGNHSRNACIFAEGELDRSPTGSGVSARAALHAAKGELKFQERARIESILGTTMTVEVVERVTFGSYDAIVPEVGGSAHITGRHEFYFDPRDPLKSGFLLR